MGIRKSNESVTSNTWKDAMSHVSSNLPPSLWGWMRRPNELVTSHAWASHVTYIYGPRYTYDVLQLECLGWDTKAGKLRYMPDSLTRQGPFDDVWISHPLRLPRMDVFLMLHSCVWHDSIVSVVHMHVQNGVWCFCFPFKYVLPLNMFVCLCASCIYVCYAQSVYVTWLICKCGTVYPIFKWLFRKLFPKLEPNAIRSLYCES